MLAKKYRLPVQIIAHAKWVWRRTPFMAVKIFPAARPYSRFAVVVGKHVCKQAVKRNALRRMIMSGIEKNRALWPIADYQVNVHPACADAPREKIYENIISLCAG